MAPPPVLLPGKSMDRGAWWAAVHGVAKSRTRLSDFPFTFLFHALEKEMATHSSILAWIIPGTEEPSGLPSMGSQSRTHDWSDLAAAYVCVCVCVCAHRCILSIALDSIVLCRYCIFTDWRFVATLHQASLLALFFQQHLLTHVSVTCHILVILAIFHFFIIV